MHFACVHGLHEPGASSPLLRQTLRDGENVFVRALVLFAMTDLSGFKCDKVAVRPVAAKAVKHVPSADVSKQPEAGRFFQAFVAITMSLCAVF